jgi:hypothetical protein
MFIIAETTMSGIPQKIRKGKNNNLRFEACIQTADDINRNRRRYPKDLLENGIAAIRPRIQAGNFLSELDHPLSREPSRQTTVLYKEASHRFMDMGWDGNRLVAVVECLRTPNGQILSNLAEDGLPVGFSLRAMGDLKLVTESGSQYHEVVGPLHCVAWDSVSYPSHAQATLIKITEGVVRKIHEGVGLGCNSLNESMSAILHESTGIVEDDNLICTAEGVCYLPSHFDQLVEQRVIDLVDKFRF